MTTTETDWRAERHNHGTLWRVHDPVRGYSVGVNLTEAEARLIAAAPAKAALCEELADALEGLWQLVENGELVRDTSRDADGPAFTMQAMTIVVHLKKAEAALAKAGRVPQ